MQRLAWRSIWSLVNICPKTPLNGKKCRQYKHVFAIFSPMLCLFLVCCWCFCWKLSKSKDRVNQLSWRKPLKIKKLWLINFAESSNIEYWTKKICFEAFYCRVVVAKFLPILVSGVKDWTLKGAPRLLSPLRRTGTLRKELREAEFGKHNW